jgi:hypothetical protein
MFPLSETGIHYQKKLSANQTIRLQCRENLWRVFSRFDNLMAFNFSFALLFASFRGAAGAVNRLPFFENQEKPSAVRLILSRGFRAVRPGR